MRAAHIEKHGDRSVLKVGELPKPEPGPGEVRVRLKYSGLNHLDIWIRKGIPGQKLTYPHILGADGAGIVDKVGIEVALVKVGDEVIVFPGVSCGTCEQCSTGWETLCKEYSILGEHRAGTNAEYVVVPQANCFQKPAALSFESAASFALVFITAWQMLVRRARFAPGENVLIHAAGSGVSTAVIQIAVEGRANVYVTAGSKTKRKRAIEMGAAAAFDYGDPKWVSEMRKTVPTGIDVVIDHVGEAQWENNIRLLKPGGRLVTCGATSGYKASTDLRHLFFRQLTLMGSTMGSKSDFPLLVKKMESGTYKAIVDTILPLEEIAQAHRLLEDREQFGKVLIRL